jgi:hypothetical protein
MVLGAPQEATVLREFQFNLTVDTASGRSTAYLLECSSPDNAWQWIADQEFGPFDTTLDVSTWLVRKLVDRKALHFR